MNSLPHSVTSENPLPYFPTPFYKPVQALLRALSYTLEWPPAQGMHRALSYALGYGSPLGLIVYFAMKSFLYSRVLIPFLNSVPPIIAIHWIPPMSLVCALDMVGRNSFLT